jgi:putative Ig domain-containing protein
MRRSRRGKSSALEFGGSGEDSFVAVVVTKLTGALLFILLLTMVIMALLPKAVDSVVSSRDVAQSGAPSDREPLRIATPGALPDAVAGRPYLVALAATGGHGTPRWSVDSRLPEWLTLEESTGRISGIPPRPTEEPLALRISAGDGTEVVSQSIQLAVLPPQSVATLGSWWKPRWHAVAWRAWLEQGFGFLVLWLVHLLGMNLLTSLERQSLEEAVVADGLEIGQIAVHRRFSSYRILIRLATLSATIALAAWLALSRGHSI